tara:strand:+ start:2657 stop:3808 length:1152 start_codon:yes stop_codon:yes gene_type:complete
MKTVVVRAPLLTMSGYGVHSRQLFRWLYQRGDINLKSNILNWGACSWIINPEAENGMVGKIMQTSSDPEEKIDVSFQLQLPNEWDPKLAHYNVGVSAVVETDICNPEWIKCCNRMDAIVVPSQHTASVLKKSGKINVPLHVISESFIDECSTIAPLNVDFETDFNFLVLGQLTDHNPYRDRKNVMFTLRWLCEAFADDPDVGIVIKTNSGKGTKIDRGITKRLLENVIQEIRPGPYPRIHFVHGHMKPGEVAGLYQHPKVKALVSATKGEGFGLPLLEAAACGLPVIATNWSGHKDFLDMEKWLKIDYELIDIPKDRVDKNIFMPGAKWADPNEKSFKDVVKRFRKKPQKPEEWAKKLQAKVHKKFSFEQIAAAYEEKFGSLL